MRTTFRAFLEAADVSRSPAFNQVVDALYQYVASRDRAGALKSQRGEWSRFDAEQFLNRMSDKELGEFIDHATSDMPWRIKGSFVDTLKDDPGSVRKVLAAKVSEMVGKAPKVQEPTGVLAKAPVQGEEPAVAPTAPDPNWRTKPGYLPQPEELPVGKFLRRIPKEELENPKFKPKSKLAGSPEDDRIDFSDW